MKKEFIKSVATAVLGLALVSSCSTAKDKEAHKCAGKNADANAAKETHKCSANKTAEKNTCKAAKEAKEAKKAKATKNVEK